MKFSNILLAGAIFLATAPSTTAAQSEQPILEFHTTLYELHGEQNAFHFYLGTKTKDYYDIDCGFGTQEYEIEPAVFDGESQGLAGTVITGTVNKDGWVKVYGDPANIDYINLDGCYINEIRFPKLTNVEILDLQNNELKALDLTDMHKLQALYLNNNPFTAET
ncbi:MAG: leucine-rich repeat domain-containing protein, partial [Duncaniella sp.]|nr:leucine-rich repeat domain-containing protein [Duncaniella sp.]